MIVPISSLSAVAYRYVAKPILFRYSPDVVHANIVKIGQFCQKSALVRGLIAVLGVSER